MPKDLLPIVDRSLTRYALDEAREARRGVHVRHRPGHDRHRREFRHGLTRRDDDPRVASRSGPLEWTRDAAGQSPPGYRPVPLGMGQAVGCARPAIED